MQKDADASQGRRISPIPIIAGLVFLGIEGFLVFQMFVPGVWPYIDCWNRLRDVPVTHVRLTQSAQELSAIYQNALQQRTGMMVRVESVDTKNVSEQVIFMNPADGFGEGPAPIMSKSLTRVRSLAPLAGEVIEVKQAPKGLVLDWLAPSGGVVAPTLFLVPALLISLLLLGSGTGLNPSGHPSQLASKRHRYRAALVIALILGPPIGAGLGMIISSYFGNHYAFGFQAEIGAIIGVIVFVPIAAVIVNFQLAQLGKQSSR